MRELINNETNMKNKNRFLKKLKKEGKGITLIALVVTIIVLLILAGVAINLTIGNDGIITRAIKAREENEKAEIVEQIKMDIAGKQIDNQGSINEDDLYEILNNYGTVSDDKSTLTTTKGNYEILISDIYSGEISSSLVTTPLSSWEYTLNDENIILNKYIGQETKILVPSTFEYNGKTYNTILSKTSGSGDSLKGPFALNNTIEEVAFENGIYVNNNTGYAMFYNCVKLKILHNFPEGILDLNFAFNNCENLINVANIPEGVTSLISTFAYCDKLQEAPIIASTVNNMDKTFLSCKSLEGTVTVLSEQVSSAIYCFNSTKKIIYIKTNIQTLTYNTFYSADNWNNVVFYGETINKIVCWGDSLTAGAGSTNIKYTSKLKELTGSLTYITSLGVGGETSKSIAIRQGGIPIYSNEFIIPSDTNKVELEIKDKEGNLVELARQGTNGLNPVTINGIEGNINYNSETNKYEFTRISTGISTIVQDNTQIITSGMKDNKEDLMIIWAGTNDNPSVESIQEVIDNIDAMIDYSNNPNYIIIGLTCKKKIPDIESINNILFSKYGEHFLDIRTYILENGLADAEIVPTLQDETDISNSEIPTSLRYDNVHFNDYGYSIVGEQVYNKLISLGYITE